MNNHDFEMCCGTTCDKQANAEYVAMLEERIVKLENELKVDAAWGTKNLWKEKRERAPINRHGLLGRGDND